MLSVEFINHLHSELARLQFEQNALAGEIELLRETMGKFGVTPKPTSPSGRDSAKTAPTNGRVVSGKVSSNFAANVRQVLAELGPSSPREITDLLESRGVRQRGNRSLIQDVNAELARMARSPSIGVKRVEIGVYSLIEKEQEKKPKT